MKPHSTSIRFSRRWLYIPFAIAAIIMIAYYGLWRVAANTMEQTAAQWTEEQRAAGYDIAHQGISRKGFPFYLRLKVDAPTVTTPEGWRWQAPILFVDALPYDLTRVIFSPFGEQSLSLGAKEQWIMNAEEAKASIGVDKKRGWVFSLSIKNGLASNGTDKGSIGQLDMDLAPSAADIPSATLMLVAANIGAETADSSWALDQFNLALELTHAGAFALDNGLDVWQYSGGKLIVSALEAQQETGTVRLNGDFSLDDNYYPAGRLDAEITNPAAITNWLADAKLMAPAEAETTGAQLTLLAIAGGGKIQAPIEFADGAVEISGVTLGYLAPLAMDQP